MGVPDRVEFFFALIQLLLEVKDLLLLAFNGELELAGAGGRAEAAAFEGLGAEEFAESVFEVANLGGEAVVAVAEVGVVGQERFAADRSRRTGPGCGLVSGGEYRCAKVCVAVDERPVDSGVPGDGRDREIGALGAHGLQGRLDTCASLLDISASGLNQRSCRSSHSTLTFFVRQQV
nr:hypothetical protein [Glycomyces tenuis]